MPLTEEDKNTFFDGKKIFKEFEDTVMVVKICDTQNCANTIIVNSLYQVIN